MSKFFSKIEEVRKRFIGEHQYGDFILFALTKLKVSPKKWDVVVCADWLPKREKVAIRLIVGELQKTLTESDLSYLSGVVVLDKNDSFIKELQNLISTKPETTYKNIPISSLSIKELRILQNTSANQEIKNSCTSEITNNSQFPEYIQKYIQECIDKIVQKKLIEQNYSSKKISIGYSQLDEYETKSNQSNNVIDFQEQKKKRVA
jgi:hypothetical protein